MDLLVTRAGHFKRAPDGTVWGNGTHAYKFWTRYLPAFDNVRVLARVAEVNAIPPNWHRADGPGVSFVAVPDYLGPKQYLRLALKIRRIVRRALKQPDAILLRGPGPIPACVESVLGRSRRPYGVEVIGDPYDVFSPGAVKHPLRPFFRWWFSRQLRRQCARAVAASYVTQRALQQRYPPAPDAVTTHFSSIDLAESAFVQAPRGAFTAKPLRIVTVGTLEQLYKAPDVLLGAVARCVRERVDLHLTFVGDGKQRPALERRVRELGLQERIVFRGQLPAGQAVITQLDRADLFVLPSRQEGLPRAMIEAMARALPCIGSTVGGIPELLPEEDLVPPGDAEALARKIAEVVGEPLRLQRMSARNLETAREYREPILRERRLAFYRQLRERTQSWYQSQNGAARNRDARADETANDDVKHLCETK